MRRRGGGVTKEEQVAPPRLAELVLRLSSPSRYRNQQLGDLREAFVTRQEQDGTSSARHWYRQQVLKSVIPNLTCAMRCRKRPRRRERAGVAALADALVQDLRYTLRSYKRRPAFFSVITLVFALGIGANTVIFSVVNGVLLRPLPYPEPECLVIPWQTAPNQLTSPNPFAHAFAHRIPIGYPVYLDWLEQNTVFEHLGVHKHVTFVATGDGPAERIRGTRVTYGVFAALGVPPILGRTFVPEDDHIEGPRLIVLSYGLWRRRFGSDSNVIGRTMILDEHPFTIVGVMPEGFRFPGSSEIWTTFSQATDLFLERDNNSFLPVARLRPNVTLDQAQRAMEILAEHLKEIHPIPGTDYGVNIVQLNDDIVRNVRPALLLLLGTVGIFLFIACANIANLLLVRASERRHELAVRLSLGAGRRRILGQHLTEGLTLSLVGGALGTLVAMVCVEPFIAILPSDTPRLSEIGMDVRILVFSAVLTIVTGATVATLPVLGTLRARLTTMLQDTSRGSSGSRHRNRTQAVLLVLQIALTFVLLLGAGLLTKSFARLTSAERGFDAEGVVTLDIDMRGSKYTSEHQQRAAYEELYERLRAIPGVTAIGATRAEPFMSTWAHDVVVETSSGQVSTSPLFDFVSGSYFQTMGISLLAGRPFLADERFRASPVVIVNDAMAQAFWPNEPAIGKRIWWEETADSDSPWLTVVGVVGDVRRQLDAEPHLTVYYPLYYGNPTIVLKTGIDPALVMDAARAAVRDVDSYIPIIGLRTLEQTIGTSIAGPRVRTVLLDALAALAAILAVVGIFGVLAYAVAQRTNEIGIRMALGAATADVIRSVVGRGLVLLGLGVAIGLAVSLMAARALESFLFEVDPIDPATLLSVTLLLAVASVVASFFPARRATKVNPVEALRRE